MTCTPENHELLLSQLDLLMSLPDQAPGTPIGDLMVELATAISEYEDKAFAYLHAPVEGE